MIGLRNNVQASFDAAWRIRPGLRVYGEILIDDLRTTGHSDVSKYGYLFGGEGVARAANGRLSWGVEYTRLTRFVYTSFYGESFTAQDAPLGYPTGPDSRRISLRGAWDPNDGWQISSSLSHTDLGESGLDHPFVPGQGSVNVSQFLGVVEHATEWRLGLRYWPSAAVDLAVTGRVRWVDNAVHLAGDRRVEPGAELRLRLVR